MLCKSCKKKYPKGIDVCPNCGMEFDYSSVEISETDLTILARYYKDLGDIKQAEKIYKIVYQINPNNTIAVNQMREMKLRRLQSLKVEAQKLEAQGIWDDNCRSVNREIILIHPGNEEALRRFEEFARRDKVETEQKDKKEKIEAERKAREIEQQKAKLYNEQMSKYLIERRRLGPKIKKSFFERLHDFFLPYDNHCFSCYRPVSSDFNNRCSRCGWYVCDCGACGCSYSGKR